MKIEEFKGIIDYVAFMFSNNLNPKLDITFFSGKKPASYYVPQMIFSSKQANLEIEMAWFCEIFIDKKCVFRESLPCDGKIDVVIEQECLNLLTKSVFSYGLFSQYNFLKENVWK